MEKEHLGFKGLRRTGAFTLTHLGALPAAGRPALPRSPPFPKALARFSPAKDDMWSVLDNVTGTKWICHQHRDSLREAPGPWRLNQAGSSPTGFLVSLPPRPSVSHLPDGCSLLSIWSSFQKHGKLNMTNGDKWKERSHKSFKVDHQQICQQL